MVTSLLALIGARWLGHSVGHSATVYSTCQGDIGWTAQQT
jgi:hypothetical protein